MSMRIEQIIARFHDVAQQPKKQMQTYLAAGLQVVLIAPAYAPEELVHAMGMVPMGVWGADLQLQEAKAYFPAFIPSALQSIVELGIRGDYDGASAIIIPSLSDSLKVLGQNWKYAVPSIPFLPMTYPQNRKPEFGQHFTIEGYRRIITQLEHISGTSFNEERLADSLAIYDRHRRGMRELSLLLAEHPEISAVERNSIYKSAHFLRKGEHSALLEELLAALRAQTPACEGKKRIVISGILADIPNLLQIFDENKLHIVADDIAAESRQYSADAPAVGEPLVRLAQQFCSRDNCSLLYDPGKGRVEALIELIRARQADGLLILLTKFCDAEEFDYPFIKKACDTNGIPCALIEVDRQMNNYEQARTLVESFYELLAQEAYV